MGEEWAQDGEHAYNDIARAIAQVVPSLRLAFLPVYVLHIVLRWLLTAPTHAREALRRCLRKLRSRVRRQSRLPRLHFAEGADGAEKGWVNVRCEKGVRKMAFRDFVRSKCPSLLREYRPSKMLFKSVLICISGFEGTDNIASSGHLQTAYSAFGDFSQVDRIVYDR